MTDNMRGILAILASATGFVINDTLVKLATDELPTGEIIFVRGVMATAILGAATSLASGWRSPRVFLQPAMAVRLVTSALATLFIVAALRYLPLATTSAILQVTPLVVTAGAALLLGAHVGWRRWTASVAGFLGVMLIVKPGSQSFVPEAWIAVTALIFTATRDLTTRFIDHSTPSILVATASSAVVMLGGLAMLPFEVWIIPSTRAMTLLGTAAVALYFAYYLGIVAMRTGEIPVVAPFRYALILLALALGYLVWGHVPDPVSFVGIAIVTGAGLYLLNRERVVMQANAKASQSAARSAQ